MSGRSVQVDEVCELFVLGMSLERIAQIGLFGCWTFKKGLYLRDKLIARAREWTVIHKKRLPGWLSKRPSAHSPSETQLRKYFAEGIWREKRTRNFSVDRELMPAPRLVQEATWRVREILPNGFLTIDAVPR